MHLALVAILPLAFVVIALMFWLTTWRSDRKPNVTAMCLSLGALSIAFSVNLFYPTLVAIMRVPSLPHVIQHAATLTFGFWLTVFCIHISAPTGKARRKITNRVVLLVAALSALATLYILGPLRAGIPAVASEYGDRPFVAPYLAVFTTHLGLAMIDVLWMSRHAGVISRRWLRRGLRLLGAASVFGLLFVLQRAASAIFTAFDAPFPWDDAGAAGVSSLLVMVAVVLLMAGVLVPPLGARWDDRLHARQLQQLWHDLTAAAPELVFRSRHRPGLRAMVTEIYDICIGPLQPYLDPIVGDRARQLANERGLSSAEQQAVREAAAIAVGLDAKTRGLPPLTTTPVLIGVSGAGVDTADVDHLILIASAYEKSPVVADTIKEFRDHDPVH